MFVIVKFVTVSHDVLGSRPVPLLRPCSSNSDVFLDFPVRLDFHVELSVSAVRRGQCVHAARAGTVKKGHPT